MLDQEHHCHYLIKQQQPDDPKRRRRRIVCLKIRARFHYESGMEYSLLVLLICFAPFSARLDFKRGKIIKETENAPFYACTENERLLSFLVFVYLQDNIDFFCFATVHFTLYFIRLSFSQIFFYSHHANYISLTAQKFMLHYWAYTKLSRYRGNAYFHRRTRPKYFALI